MHHFMWHQKKWFGASWCRNPRHQLAWAQKKWCNGKWLQRPGMPCRPLPKAKKSSAACGAEKQAVYRCAVNNQNLRLAKRNCHLKFGTTHRIAAAVVPVEELYVIHRYFKTAAALAGCFKLRNVYVVTHGH